MIRNNHAQVKTGNGLAFMTKPHLGEENAVELMVEDLMKELRKLSPLR